MYVDMVVSGVPKRNGSAHAAQIAEMALDIVKATKTFTIPHLPKESLKIRVGLHSGKTASNSGSTKN